MSDENSALRERSGEINSASSLVTFLYLLLRDKMSAGEVESLARAACKTGSTCYTNGWLANYANDIAERLKG